MANKLKTIRDNETSGFESTHSENVSSQDDKLARGDMSEVLYSIIRKLNYWYDTTTDKDRREAILDKKARLIIQLLLLEEK